MKRYDFKPVQTEYGFWIDAVDIHQHAQKMGRIFAQIAAHTPENMDLLEELGELIKDLYIPDAIIHR